VVRSYETTLEPFARLLRSRMTDAEQWLWHKLRRNQILGVQFYRQKPLGPNIVDFYGPAVSIVIEVDGGQHHETDHAVRDCDRDLYLQRLGLDVLRFDNRQVLTHGSDVLEVIWAQVRRRVAFANANPPNPFSKGGRVSSFASGYAYDLPAFSKGGMGDFGDFA
jgi:very-short-patch-repair endonuclease